MLYRLHTLSLEFSLTEFKTVQVGHTQPGKQSFLRLDLENVGVGGYFCHDQGEDGGYRFIEQTRIE